MEAIRKSSTSKNDLKYIGMQCVSYFHALRRTSVRLSNRLRNSISTVRIDSNVPVLTQILDSYVSTVSVPDHLFIGLSRNVLSISSSQLSSRHARLSSKRGICLLYQAMGSSKPKHLGMGERCDVSRTSFHEYDFLSQRSSLHGYSFHL